MQAPRNPSGTLTPCQRCGRGVPAHTLQFDSEATLVCAACAANELNQYRKRSSRATVARGLVGVGIAIVAGGVAQCPMKGGPGAVADPVNWVVPVVVVLPGLLLTGVGIILELTPLTPPGGDQRLSEGVTNAVLDNALPGFVVRWLRRR
jgi:hypothetical protein